MPGESQDAPSTGRPDPTVMTTEQMLLAIKNLEKLTESKFKISKEKFKSIETQLQLIERQRVEQKKDTKDAVDAALSAAKEAVKEQTTASQLATNKTESSFAEQLKQSSATQNLGLAAVTSSVNDLKERVGKIENVRLGATESHEAQRLNVGALVGVAGLALSLLVAAVSIAIALSR
jgi:hypothetical protein